MASSLTALSVKNFKAFQSYRLKLAGDTYLVGPNNAGKSTLIAALRASANMLKIAKSRSPDFEFEHAGEHRKGFAIAPHLVGLVDENLRHEFRQDETVIELSLSDRRKLTAYWPAGESLDGYFYLSKGGAGVLTAKHARETFPTLGVVPVLTPAERNEQLLSDRHVQVSVETRLASRHFRNQLLRLQAENRFDEFREFCRPWLYEIELRELEVSNGALDLYYRESGSKSDREVFWAGDGLQIWLQILYHVFRLSGVDSVVLDEPDVFLHPDYQRRLVDLLRDTRAQTIMATHAPEVVAEADPECVAWVSKNRRRDTRAPKSEVLSELSSQLGTQFNLQLARTLKSNCVVFVEGSDVKVLRLLARQIGEPEIFSETNISIVRLDGVDNADHLEAFGWLSQEVLKGTAKTFVVLDRDFKHPDRVKKIEQKLRKVDIIPHVWKRHELENYLLNSAAISRCASVDESEISALLDASAAELESDMIAGCTAEWDKHLRRNGIDLKATAAEATTFVKSALLDPKMRLQVAPGKEVLSRLNQKLQSDGHSMVSARGIASKIELDEIPKELVGLLHRISEFV